MNTSKSALSIPLWLKELLPEPTVPHLLSSGNDTNGDLQLKAPDGSVQYFESVKDLSRSKYTNAIDIIFDDSISTDLDCLFYEAENKNIGMIIPYSDANRLQSLERSYSYFLSTQKKYEAEPQSFVNCWQFIDSHPAFWTCPDLKDYPWSWNTEGYCSKLRQWVSINSEGKTVVTLEGGGHVPVASHSGKSAYTEHYGDWRLEVNAETFEEAIIELAYRVTKSFNNEGETLSEDSFPVEPPEWIVEARDRLKEYKSES